MESADARLLDTIKVEDTNPAKTITLVKTDNIEIIRLVMAAGKVLPEHKAHGEITVQCLEGKLAFTALGHSTLQRLRSSTKP